MSDHAVALIRGINVAGQKKLPMADLRAALEAAGLAGVRSYIQSGNVVAESAAPAELARVVRETIQASFGYEVDVIGRSHHELLQTLEQNPFQERTPTPEDAKLGYLFLSAEPMSSALDNLDPEFYAPDEIDVAGDLAYLWVKNGFGRSKLTTSFLERRLGVHATMRNHRTLARLIEMSA